LTIIVARFPRAVTIRRKKQHKSAQLSHVRRKGLGQVGAKAIAGHPKTRRSGPDGGVPDRDRRGYSPKKPPGGVGTGRRYGGGVLLNKPQGTWTKIGIAVAGLVLGWLCYSVASNLLTYMHTAPEERH
jgi:hypothetical protein